MFQTFVICEQFLRKRVMNIQNYPWNHTLISNRHTYVALLLFAVLAETEMLT
jgi:hypothetical protein